MNMRDLPTTTEAYKLILKDLQQKLLQSQASEARLRELLNEVLLYLDTSAYTHLQIDKEIREALSTPPNTTELILDDKKVTIEKIVKLSEFIYQELGSPSDWPGFDLHKACDILNEKDE
jgi:hypothetical protein